MKPLLVCVCILLVSVSAFAQNLTLNSLMKLRKMEVPEINRKLSRKGWSFMSDNKPTKEVMGKAVWAYSPDPTGEGATAWCVLYYNETSPSRILYNVYEGNAIQKIQKKFRRRKMRPISEGNILERVEQLERYADYPDDKYMYRVLKYKQPGSSGIKIFEKTDYETAQKNGRL